MESATVAGSVRFRSSPDRGRRGRSSRHARRFQARSPAARRDQLRSSRVAAEALGFSVRFAIVRNWSQIPSSASEFTLGNSRRSTWAEGTNQEPPVKWFRACMEVSRSRSFVRRRAEVYVPWKVVDNARAGSWTTWSNDQDSSDKPPGFEETDGVKAEELRPPTTCSGPSAHVGYTQQRRRPGCTTSTGLTETLCPRSCCS